MVNSLNQQTYEQIRKDIMTFALKPGGMVSAAKLAERYQVSRTPAREALVRLHDEGIVDIFPKSKSVISKINVRLARQEWFIRKTLELGMVDDFFDHVTAKDIAQMKEYYGKQLQVAEQTRTHELSYIYLLNDNEFHAVTYKVAGQELAANVISNTMAHYARVRLLIDLESENQDRTLSDHAKLIQFVEAGDREGYRECLTRHLGYVLDDIEKIGQLYPDFFEEL